MTVEYLIRLLQAMPPQQAVRIDGVYDIIAVQRVPSKATVSIVRLSAR